MPRTIVITVNDKNDFGVSEGDRYHDRLCWDEMLGAIAELTHPGLGPPRYPMMTAAEHKAREDRWAARRVDIIAPDNQGEQHAE